MKKKKSPYEAQMDAHARVEARVLLKAINDHVPEQVEGIPYARQCVLEKVISILQEAV